MPVYIGMDSTMYQFDWLLKEKVPLGLRVKQSYQSESVDVSLSINGNLYITYNGYDYHLVSKNVKDFVVTKFLGTISMGYVTEKGDIYISGYILFARNIFIAPLFKSILVNLADESWD